MTTPFLAEVSLQGFLSYGVERTSLALTPLNLLIGPNGSGKSNLVEALSVLRAVPKDLPLPIRAGGGVRDWLWKGDDDAAEAVVEIVTRGTPKGPSGELGPQLRYRLTFGAEADRFTVLDERLENALATPGHGRPYFYFGYEHGRPMLSVRGESGHRELRRQDIDPAQSILSQRRDPDAYPELSHLADLLSRIVIYRDWSFGPDSPIRQSCRADARSDLLSEALDNLPCRLAVLKRDPRLKKAMLARLADLAPGFNDIEVIPEGGRLQLYLTEGTRNIAAHRLSDGTLRYLSLLAILLDPSPAPLTVIEEPELGLHFDMMPKIAELLQLAAQTTQLVVTTHSDALVDALTGSPESIIVCQKGDHGTTLRRLDPKRTVTRETPAWYALDQGRSWRNAVVAFTLYVEGGGESKALRTACREGFSKLIEKAGFKGSMPSVVACGSRSNAFDSFATAAERQAKGHVPLLLVDSEAPVSQRPSPWAHVRERAGDGWTKPGRATDDQLHLMVECMEAWLVADRAALTAYFGQGFSPRALPAATRLIEAIPKDELYRALAKATKQCKTKGAYDKAKHSFGLLATVDPSRLRAASPWAERFFATLEAKR
jgi:predicted ATPase